MTNQVKEALYDIADWFSRLDDTYIRFFNCHIIPHVMLRYVTKKVVLQEVPYQLKNGLSPQI